MREAAFILETIGFWLYAVPFLALGVSALGGLRAPWLDRFMAIGPILGLALGGCIVGALSGIWLDHGAFSWDHSSDIEIAQQVTFFLMWVSNIKFEIWTLETIRKGEPGDSVNAELTVRRHLWLHCSLLSAVIALSYLS